VLILCIFGYHEIRISHIEVAWAAQAAGGLAPRADRAAGGDPGLAGRAAGRTGDQKVTVISLAIFGVPIPVASSYPRVTGNRPLLLVVWPAPVMSWK